MSDVELLTNDDDGDNHSSNHRVKAKKTGKIPTIKAAMAEFLGTFIMIVFGNGVCAQSVLSGGENGGYLSINFGWALGVIMGIYCSGGSSGGHLNPAITVALAVHGKFPWSRVIPYILAQFAGAFAAAALVYLLYIDAINAFDGGVRAISGVNGTAGIFATYPQEYLSVGGGVVDQTVGTAVLACGVFALIDPNSAISPPAAITPILVGLLVLGIGVAIGLNSGYAINPARDLPPRLFTSFVYGSEVFTANHGWAWIPATVPFLGAIVGSTVYVQSTMPEKLWGRALGYLPKAKSSY